MSLALGEEPPAASAARRDAAVAAALRATRPSPSRRRASLFSPPVLVAVAQVESHFRPKAVSHAGARGLLQVMPTTARSLELSADEPEANVLAGARYLRGLLDRFRSTDLALAAYNAGPTAVARLGGAPTRATVAYVANVTRIWRELNGCR